MICSTIEEDIVPTERPILPEDLLSLRSSMVSNASSVTDLKRDQHSVLLGASHTQSINSSASSSPSRPTMIGGARTSHFTSNASTASMPTRSKRARFENKIRLLAQYMRTLSMGLAPRQRTPPATVASHSQSQRGPVPQIIKRRSQASLSQYSLPRSAPDVLDPNKSQRSLLSEPSRDGPTATARISSSSHNTALEWDEIIAGAVFVEENEVMPASPHSRKRGRPCRELFEDSEMRRLCKQCGVPDENLDEVVKMLFCQFGTCHLDLTALHDLVGKNSVVVIGMLVFSCIDCGEELLDLHSLPAFLMHIQSRYDPTNPFHNACHAADVLHSFFIMLWSTELGARISAHNQIGALFAAIMHDIDHIGLTNDFLLKTNHDLATKYPTSAPMEEMHAAVALDLLTDTKFNVLAKLCNEQLEQVVTIVRESIHSTALCYQKDLLRDVAAIPVHEWEAPSGILPLQLQTVVLRCVMHVSDISQTMKPFEIHNKWVMRLNEENFRQGDLDAKLKLAVCPESYYREKWTLDAFLTSQIWFLRNLAFPAAKCLNSIPWVHMPILEANLEANIAQWQAKRSGLSLSCS